MHFNGEVRQILATLCVNLLSCSLGSLMGWTSSGIKFLESKDSDLTTGSLTPAESGLINSMFSVGGLLGSLLYGVVCDKIGRKWALRSVAVPQIISYLLIAFASNSFTILMSRVFAGFAGGALYICIPLFVSEISEDMIRGSLGSLFVLMAGIGLLFSYILGSFMHYNTCVWVYALFPIMFLIGSVFLHETPFHLLTNNKLKEAEASILFYRGEQRLTGNARIEFESIKLFLKSFESEAKVSLSDFLTKAARKSIIIGTVLVALEQFSGCFALLFYTASVFEKAGATSIAPEHSTIIVGVIQLVGAYCSTFMVDRAGRKVLICFSGFAISVGMTIFGIATQLIEHGNASTIIKIIPIFALSFSVFVANVGVFTLTFVVLSEISPSNVKSYIFTFCMSMSWVFNFAVFNLFSPLTYTFGLGGTMYFFAICSVAGAIFTLFYIPETMGKSLEEIARMMER